MDTAKDMYKVYSRTSTMDLIANKHRKINELTKVAGIPSYWARKDAARLVHMIRQIDAILEARRLQDPLF